MSITYVAYIVYLDRFYYVMYNTVLKICIGGRCGCIGRGLFLLLLPANYTVAKEYLIPLYKEHRKHRTFNTETPSVTSNQIEKMKNKAQFLEQKILFHVNINRKITCKIVWKMQCLKNEIQFIRRLSKSQLTLFPPMYLDLVVTDIRWGLNYPHHTFFWIENCY